MTDYFIDLVRIMLSGVPVYALARILFLLRRARKLGAKAGVPKVKLRFHKLREIFLGLFVIFIMALLVFVWQGEYHSPRTMLQIARFRLQTREGMNLVPFHTIQNYYRVYGVHGGAFGINVLGNILMFVPWGFGLALLWEKNRSLPKLFTYSAAFPILIECTQLFIWRQVDVDDLILNFLGGMLGGFLYLLLARLWPRLQTLAL